jgi:hypothetical protein
LAELPRRRSEGMDRDQAPGGDEALGEAAQAEGGAPEFQLPPEAVSFEGLPPERRAAAEEARSMIEYLLEPHVPRHMAKKFRQYEMLVSKNLALANIPREWIGRYLTYFDIIRLWLKLGEYEVAVNRMARLSYELWLTRSVGGFESLLQRTQRQVVEQLPLEGAPEKKPKKRRWIF